MEFEQAKQYRDNYIQDRKDAGSHVSDRNGLYISATIKDQGKTGKGFFHGCQHCIAQTAWILQSRWAPHTAFAQNKCKDEHSLSTRGVTKICQTTVVGHATMMNTRL